MKKTKSSINENTLRQKQRQKYSMLFKVVVIFFVSVFVFIILAYIFHIKLHVRTNFILCIHTFVVDLIHFCCFLFVLCAVLFCAVLYSVLLYLLPRLCAKPLMQQWTQYRTQQSSQQSRMCDISFSWIEIEITSIQL